MEMGSCLLAFLPDDAHIMSGKQAGYDLAGLRQAYWQFGFGSHGMSDAVQHGQLLDAPPQRLLGLYPLGDVGAHGKAAPVVALGIQDRAGRNEHGDRAAVSAPENRLVAVGKACSAPGEPVQVVLLLLGGEDPDRGLAQQLVTGPARHGTHRVVHVGQQRILVHHGQALAHVLDEEPVPLLARPQRLLGLPFLGDIQAQRHKTQHVSLFVQVRNRVHLPDNGLPRCALAWNSWVTVCRLATACRR